MLKSFSRFSNYLHKSANLKTLVLAFLAHLVFAIFIIPKAQSLIDTSQTQTLLDWRFGYSETQINAIFKAIGPVGRKAYLFYSAIIDVLYALVYSLSFSLLLSVFFRNSFSKTHYFQYFNVFPFLVGIFDIFENVAITYLLIVFPSENHVMAKLASAFSLIKWGCTIYNLLLLMIGMFGWGFKNFLFKKR